MMGLSAIVRKALVVDVTVAVVFPVAPAVAFTPSHTTKPPPSPLLVPSSYRSVRVVRFAFACALNAAPFASLARETICTMRVLSTVVVTPVTVTEVLAVVLVPPPVTSHGSPASGVTFR